MENEELVMISSIQEGARCVLPTMVTGHPNPILHRLLWPSLAALLAALSLGACEDASEASVHESAHAAAATRTPAPPAPAELALGYVPEGEATPTDALIAAAQDAVRAAPESAEAHIGLATLFLRRRRETSDAGYALYAQDALRVARALGDDPRAELLHGMMLQDQHRFAEARDVARRVLRRAPELPTAHMVLGDALLELGDYDGAVDAYQAALDIRPDLRSYDRGAHLRWLHGDREGAIELLELAIDAGSARDPESMAFCFVDLGHIYLREGDTRRALAAADRARELVPDYLPAVSLAGKTHAMAGDAAAAIEALTASVARRPGAEDLLALSEIERSEGDAAAADRHLAQARRLAEPRPMAVYLARHDAEPAEALRLAERAMQARQNIAARDAHALALLRVGRTDEALAAIDRALALGTPDARLHLHRALVLAVRGDRAGAAEALGAARAINPRVDPLVVSEVERRAGLAASGEGRGA